MLKISILFLSTLVQLSSQSPPCPNNCLSCSSSTACLSCGSQYFASVASGSLQCLPCPQFCLQCSSASACTRCMDPYIAQGDGTCQPCQISNALTCSSVVAASSCRASFYVNDNYCSNCLLNCGECSSNADCRTCLPGYFLNSSVLTCNFCPANCLTCNAFSPSSCLSCTDGYSLTPSNTCTPITCTLLNCLFCSSVNQCGRCIYGYYWNASASACMLGGSIVCEYGAEGPQPNQCNNKCGDMSYSAGSNGSALWCVVYRNVKANDSIFAQVYYYAYNHVGALSEMSSNIGALTLQSTGEYSYSMGAGVSLYFPSLASYYQLTLVLKYRSPGPLLVTITATTQQLVQSEQALLPAQPTPALASIRTAFVHSNNVRLAFNGSLGLVEVLVRARRCPANCYRCLNELLCEMCQQPQYMSAYKCVDNCTVSFHLVVNRTCVTACPSGFYPNTLGVNQRFCEPCVSPCLTCASTTRCLTCIAGRYLLGSQCIAVCLDTYYGGNGTCQPCISPCRLCTNQTACLSCRLGFWDNNASACTNQCPGGYFGNPATAACEPCQSPCATCRNSSSRCLSCVAGLYYFNFQCLAACPTRFYPLTTTLTCAACQPPCLTCSSPTLCLTCSFNYLFNGSCVSACPAGQYEDLGQGICMGCPSECSSCQSPTLCTGCTIGRCLFEGVCLNACPDAKYFKLVILSGTASQQCQCQQCIYPCKECLNATECLSCLQGFLLNSQCLNTCPLGYYPNSSLFQCLTCQSRYPNCLQCNSTQCTRCAATLVLHNGTCLAACPGQHFRSAQVCIRCVPPCLECISVTACLSCVVPFIFNSGGCILQCPFGRVAIVSSNLSSCVACRSPCVTCQNSDPDNCTLCVTGKYLHSPTNKCISQCSSLTPTSTFYNQPITSSCARCMFPCRMCLSQTHCLSCQIGYLTAANKCENCPSATYASVTGVCLVCPSACSGCYSADYCIGCNAGFYLYGHQCVSDVAVCLANGYYPIGRVCQPCQSPCRTCTASARNCLSCQTGYIFYQSRCLTQCPRGTYLSNATCQPCHPYCETCSGTATYCFSCRSGYLMILSEMRCVTSCPSKTFLRGATCQPCQYPCLQCLSPTQCLSCITGTLSNSSCLSSCLSGQYSDSAMQCQPCQTPCSQCQGTASTCRRCVAGFYLLNSTCIDSCPATYFAQGQASQCLGCLGLCVECSSYINCTTCSNNLTYYRNSNNNYGQCVSECPLTFYPQSVPYPLVSSTTTRSQCLPCLPQCLTCSTNLSCTLCADNKVQHLGSCLAECPGQMYSHSGICQPCSAPCLNCSDTFTCTACMDDSFLLVGSAECIVGEVCPEGFYRIPGTRLCNGRCPAGYYHRNDRTCSVDGCDVDEYKGADMYCYRRCPTGYIANEQYKCIGCQVQQCSDGLFYQIENEIIDGRLYLYVIFTQQPVYLIYPPVMALEPRFQYQIVQLVNGGRLLAASNTVSASRNITLQLMPDNSFSEQQLTLTFVNALHTFANPIQRTSKTIVIEGYDMYPADVAAITVGFLLLTCALVGLVKNPYATDYAQLVYLLALVNLHYPNNLATLLSDARLAHLSGILNVGQVFAAGPAKFKSVTDMGLISNCVFNLLVLAVGLCVALVLFVVYQVLRRLVHYNKVEQQPQQAADNSLQTQIIVDNNQSKAVQLFQCLHNNFIQNFYILYLNRLVYFNYLPVAVFTFGQLSNMYFGGESTVDLLASILSVFTLIGLICCPVYTFVKSKPKYSFLMLRKLILALVVVFAVEDPTYMIGVTAVISIMSGILVGAYGIEKWKLQSKFNAGMEISQTLLMVLLAIFAMIGEGNSTMVRLYLSWVVVALVIAICVGYLLFAGFCFGLWVLKRWKGVDYVQIWAKREQAEDGTDNDSETVGSSKKNENQQKAQESANNIKLLTAEKLFSNLSIPRQSQNQLRMAQEISMGRRPSETPIMKQQLFWTYNENEDQDSDQKSGQQEKKPPQMLIRCINQFSDVDSRQENNQK